MPWVEVVMMAKGQKPTRHIVAADTYGVEVDGGDEVALVAVHKLLENPTLYGVTHAPSGWRLFWYTEQWRARGAAREAARILARDPVWRSSSALTIETWAAFDGAAERAELKEVFYRWRNAATAEEAAGGVSFT